jgi:uncharacterized protein YegP (UPF0339 family)
MSKPKMPSIEIYVDSSGKSNFKIKNRKGEVIASSGVYETKKLCLQGINGLNDAMWQYEVRNIKPIEIKI